MTGGFLSKIGSALFTGKLSDYGKKFYSQKDSRKKLFYTATITGGFLVFISSFVLASNSYNNQQISGTTADDPSKEQIVGSTSGEQTTLAPQGPGQVAEEDANESHNGNSKTTVNIQSSTSSDDGVVSQSYVKEINGEKVKDTIIKTSDDGNSTVRLSVDADNESKTRVRQRDGSIKIDYSQKTRTKN